MAKEKTIDQFGGWEDQAQQHDFFGETNLKEDVMTTVSKDDIVDPEETATTLKDKEETAAQEALLEEQFKSFGTTSSEEEDDEEDEEEPEGKITKTPITKIDNVSTLQFLKDKGLVDFEVEEGKVLTDEEAGHLLEDSWEKSIEEEVEATIKELPQEVQDLIKYASKGGNVMQLLATMAVQAKSGVNKDSDISTEEVQISALSIDLRAQGYDQEDIDAQIEFLKDNGKLPNIARKAYDKIIAKQEEETKGEVQRATQSIENKKKMAREYKTNITAHIGAMKEIGGLPVSKEDKLSLPTYISEPVVEMQDGRFVSELQAGLFKIMADKDKVVLLAKLVKTDFDFSAIERSKETAAARGVRQEVQRTETDNKTGSHKPKRKTLADMLGD